MPSERRVKHRNRSIGDSRTRQTVKKGEEENIVRSQTMSAPRDLKEAPIEADC